MTKQLLITISTLAALRLISGCAGGGGSTDPVEIIRTNSGEVSFSKTVQPILADHCSRCHAEKKKGALSIMSYKDVIKGGKTPGFVKPNNPDGSKLITSVEKTATPFMPPRIFPSLTEDRLQALRQWIKEGAKDN